MRFERCRMLPSIERFFKQSSKNYANAEFASAAGSHD